MALCRLLVAVTLLATTALAWDQQPDGYEVIDAPAPGQSIEEWRQRWTTWREMELQSVRYDARDTCNIYNIESAQWTQHSFVQVFLMLHDRDIYNRERDEYTVSQYVSKMEARVGKIDTVLLWPAYPNSGIDNRNQWDFLRSVPGGVPALRQLVQDFHSFDIRVILPYNPWDTATRDEDGLEDLVRMYAADVHTISSLLPQLGADGFNGDTMYGVPKSFFNCSAPIVATPEGGVPSAFLSHNPISWGYYYGFSYFPPVARAKFLEPRHMVQVCARWSLDRLNEVQMAFFNAVGYVVWENVWGIWNAMTDRESEAIKRAFHVLRTFRDFTASPRWRPFAFVSDDNKIFASAFPHPHVGGNKTAILYTIISTATEPHTLVFPTKTTAIRAYDVYRGTELALLSNASVKISLEPRGMCAVLVLDNAEASDFVPGFSDYMAVRQRMTEQPLGEFSSRRDLLEQKIERNNEKPVAHNGNDVPLEMVLVRGAQAWWFNVSGVQIEPVPAWTPNWMEFGTGVQFPWEARPWNNHSVRLDVRDFLIDRYPVTNKQFRDFLTRSGYKPRTLERFLEHWVNRTRSLDQWEIPNGMEESPVVFVSVEDARAYAKFQDKRLPHDWEWQFVASNGANYDRYPWGATRLNHSEMPEITHVKSPRLPDPVGSFSSSGSKATGVHDLVGLVWQMTDQFCDAHTCGLLLRGGSYYRPIASTLADPNWYFPQAYEATKHNKFLMLGESYDRSAFIGFRCVRDITPATI